MEILVHVSAPSTAQDDARYRAQVDAILACQSAQQWQTLEPAETRDTSPRQSTHPISIQPHGQDDPARSDHHLARLEPIATTIGPSPLAPLDRVHHPVSVQVQDSLESLVSVIPDSQPETETYHPIRSPDPCPHATREDCRASDANPPSKRCRIDSSLPAARSISDPSATITTLPAIPPSISGPVAPVSPFTSTRENLGRVSPLQEPCHLLPFLPLEIHPAPPPISTVAFTTHITPTLSMLTERLKPARTYKPHHQTRSLHPLERGYWATRMTLGPDKKESEKADSLDQDQDQDHHWDLSTFHRFWSFLSDFIGKDSRAGWGVWCILERTGTSPPFVSSDPLESSSESIQVQLKVYTWGEIAMHVYLLLFLASERRIRGMELQWRDSREEVVIQMP